MVEKLQALPKGGHVFFFYTKQCEPGEKEWMREGEAKKRDLEIRQMLGK